MSGLNKTDLRTWAPLNGSRKLELGFVYVIAVGGRFKIGKSGNVDQCLTAAKRWDHSAKILVCWPTVDPLVAEGDIHSALARWSSNPVHEQFDLPPSIVERLTEMDDVEFNAWLDAGLPVPVRLKHYWAKENEGFVHQYFCPAGFTRVWRCVVFRESGVFGDFAYVAERKPPYSVCDEIFAANLHDAERTNAYQICRVL